MLIKQGIIALNKEIFFFIYFISAIVFSILGVWLNNKIRGQIKPEVIKVQSGIDLVPYNETNGKPGFCFIRLLPEARSKLLDEDGKEIPIERTRLNKWLRAQLFVERMITVKEIKKRIPLEQVNVTFEIDSYEIETEAELMIESPKRKPGQYYVKVGNDIDGYTPEFREDKNADNL